MPTLTLRDGRRLGFRAHGDPRGAPVLWFHGTPSSRLSPPPDCATLEAARVRLVVLERPGYGVSDPKPGRTLLDWAGDVREATFALGIDRFAVCGFSGGGPYAAACAHALPDRVKRLVVVASAPPPGSGGLALRARAAFFLASRAPRLLDRVLARRAFSIASSRAARRPPSAPSPP